MDERLQSLMQELGNAINESLSDSEKIAGAIGEIRKAGYDIFIVIEVTIGFRKKEDSDEEEEINPETREIITERGEEETVSLKFTTQDQKFLRCLKISTEDEDI